MHSRNCYTATTRTHILDYLHQSMKRTSLPTTYKLINSTGQDFMQRISINTTSYRHYTSHGRETGAASSRSDYKLLTPIHTIPRLQFTSMYFVVTSYRDACAMYSSQVLVVFFSQCTHIPGFFCVRARHVCGMDICTQCTFFVV